MSTADEIRRPGDLPLWDVPGWWERFGILAGVTGRGDDPAAPFDLGLSGQQPVGTAMGRWRRFLGSFGDCPGSVLARQVHGTKLLWHEGGPRGWAIVEGADGHLTATAGLLLLVTVADCVPVYLVAPKYRTIALLHAGWRGTAGGILARGVAEITSRSGCGAPDIVMHCGVAISGGCYEVGSEVLSALEEPVVGAGPWHVDLREVLARQGSELGIGEVTVSGHCTARESGAFFSHRRSHGADGRMIAWIGYPAGDSAPG